MGPIFRTITRLTPAVMFPLRGNLLDQPATPEPSTGMERLRKMYSMRTHEGISEELNMVVQSVFSGAFIGGCVGGWVRSRNAYLYFMETNQATIFKSTNEAKKKLQEAVTIAFGKGAWQWGWRIGAFLGIFSLVSTTIRVYRGDITLLEFVAGGVTAGGLYKLNMGPTAMLVGALLGGALSTVFGGIMILILKVTGITADDIKKALFKFREFREHHYNEALEKSAQHKHDEVTMHHKVILAGQGEKKLEEIE